VFAAPTDIVVDMNGWFSEGSACNAVGPKRVFDTRQGQSPDALRNVSKAELIVNTMMEVQLTDLAGFVPGSGVGAVSSTGTVCFYTLATTHLIVDINGWFAT